MQGGRTRKDNNIIRDKENKIVMTGFLYDHADGSIIDNAQALRGMRAQFQNEFETYRAITPLTILTSPRRMKKITQYYCNYYIKLIFCDSILTWASGVAAGPFSAE